MFKIALKKKPLLISTLLLSIYNSAFAVDFFAGNQFGWRDVSNVSSSDDQNGALRIYAGALWPIDFNNQYLSNVKAGFEVAGVTGFSARVNVAPSPTSGTRFMPLNLNFSDSLDFLVKAKANVKAVKHNVFLAAGGNHSVMKPLNAITSADSISRTVPKIMIGLERPINNNWSYNLALHHLFNSYDGKPKANTVAPFDLSGFVAQTMVTVGFEYSTPLA